MCIMSIVQYIMVIICVGFSNIRVVQDNHCNCMISLCILIALLMEHCEKQWHTVMLYICHLWHVVYTVLMCSFVSSLSICFAISFFSYSVSFLAFRLPFWNELELSWVACISFDFWVIEVSGCILRVSCLMAWRKMSRDLMPTHLYQSAAFVIW